MSTLFLGIFLAVVRLLKQTLNINYNYFFAHKHKRICRCVLYNYNALLVIMKTACTLSLSLSLLWWFPRVDFRSSSAIRYIFMNSPSFMWCVFQIELPIGGRFDYRGVVSH